MDESKAENWHAPMDEHTQKTGHQMWAYGNGTRCLVMDCGWNNPRTPIAATDTTVHDKLRALTKPCPNCEGKNPTTKYKHSGAVTRGTCETCHGDGTIPALEFMWEPCGYQSEENVNHPGQTYCDWLGKDCPCKGTRRMGRTPTPGEIELALFDAHQVWIDKFEDRLCMVNQLCIWRAEWGWQMRLYVLGDLMNPADAPIVVGTDPDDCRAWALLSLMEAK